MKQISATILLKKQLSADFFEMTFEWNAQSGEPLPGQFLTIRVSDLTMPLLRRPLAFSGYNPQKRTASVIFQQRGPATTLLAGKREGDALDIIGPLGRPFHPPFSGGKAITVAGGVGLGPILFLAQWLRDEGSPAHFIFGARNQEAVPPMDLFAGLNPQICTDDGSRGFAGTTADFLPRLDPDDLRNATLYCCGPTPMLKACDRFAQNRALACQVSMEQVMACGVGACMGCVIKVKSSPGYARVCTEGPVFDSREVVWS